MGNNTNNNLIETAQTIAGRLEDHHSLFGFADVTANIANAKHISGATLANDVLQHEMIVQVTAATKVFIGFFQDRFASTKVKMIGAVALKDQLNIFKKSVTAGSDALKDTAAKSVLKHFISLSGVPIQENVGEMKKFGIPNDAIQKVADGIIADLGPFSKYNVFPVLGYLATALKLVDYGIQAKYLYDMGCAIGSAENTDRAYDLTLDVGLQSSYFFVTRFTVIGLPVLIAEGVYVNTVPQETQDYHHQYVKSSIVAGISYVVSAIDYGVQCGKAILSANYSANDVCSEIQSNVVTIASAVSDGAEIAFDFANDFIVTTFKNTVEKVDAAACAVEDSQIIKSLVQSVNDVIQSIENHEITDAVLNAMDNGAGYIVGSGIVEIISDQFGLKDAVYDIIGNITYQNNEL